MLIEIIPFRQKKITFDEFTSPESEVSGEVSS
jgi:hypothetical protein